MKKEKEMVGMCGEWRLVVSAATLLAATCVLAMPTRRQLEEAQTIVQAITADDLRALKHDCSESGLRNIIMRWKRDGWIEPVDRHHFRKTSQCPIVPTSH